jgi:hypothetical protein
MDGVAQRLGHERLGVSPKRRRMGLRRLTRLWTGDPPSDVDTQEWDVEHDA